MTINHPQIAFAHSNNPGRVELWCTVVNPTDQDGWYPAEKREHAVEGGIIFYVINGHWEGCYKDGKIDGGIPVEIVWQGKAPFRYEDYNEAIVWIESEIASNAQSTISGK